MWLKNREAQRVHSVGNALGLESALLISQRQQRVDPGGKQSQQGGFKARPAGQLTNALVHGLKIDRKRGFEARNLGADPAAHHWGGARMFG